MISCLIVIAVAFILLIWYIITKCRKYDVNTIVVITTVDHYLLSYNTVKICKENINNKDINMVLYTDTVDNPDE